MYLLHPGLGLLDLLRSSVDLLLQRALLGVGLDRGLPLLLAVERLHRGEVNLVHLLALRHRHLTRPDQQDVVVDGFRELEVVLSPPPNLDTTSDYKHQSASNTHGHY